ncbi:Phage internal (core) protein [hydrothermal vent metagenome]|uniref:Phage internal (Core) protein n=1 Tax=hydrothermal vent metagenome TaxID=652676 RepID=A0A3B0QSU8_9ZZZZ
MDIDLTMGYLSLQGLTGKGREISTVICAVVLSLCFTTAAFADYYSYVDDKGAIHYTNVPRSAEYKWIMAEGGGGGRSGSSFVSYDELIHHTARKYEVPAELVWAIVKTESDFDPYVVSKAGAVGLMQLMPETARLMGVRDRYDPAQNIEGGVKFLSQLLERFNGKEFLAIAAYNAGETAVRRYNDRIPPFKETRRFVMKVNKYKELYLKTVKNIAR